MIMTDFPYPTNFLKPMPANPVNASCQAFSQWNNDTTSQADEDLLTAFVQAASFYNNYTGDLKCLDIKEPSFETGSLSLGGGFAYNYLFCTQIPQYTSRRNTSMFGGEKFDRKDWDKYCKEHFNATVQWDWAYENFGGYDYTKDFQRYSNIMFSNGDRDPWGPLGVTQYISQKMPVTWIKGGAHHLDLRTPNEDDPEDCKSARKQHEDYITQWVADYQGMPEIKKFIS